MKMLNECSSGGCTNTAPEGYKTCARCREASERSRQKRRKEWMCRFCNNRREPGVATCAEHRGLGSEYQKRSRMKLKRAVYEHYDGACACCGETEILFMSVDHIHNDGAEHRKVVGGSHTFYKWLIKNNFPAGFQMLCFNCNLAKGFFGVCPHQSVCGSANQDRNLDSSCSADVKSGRLTGFSIGGSAIRKPEESVSLS